MLPRLASSQVAALLATRDYAAAHDASAADRDAALRLYAGVSRPIAPFSAVVGQQKVSRLRHLRRIYAFCLLLHYHFLPADSARRHIEHAKIMLIDIIYFITASSPIFPRSECNAASSAYDKVLRAFLPSPDGGDCTSTRNVVASLFTLLSIDLYRLHCFQVRAVYKHIYAVVSPPSIREFSPYWSDQ